MSRPIRTVVYCVLLLMAIVWLAARAEPLPAPSDETPYAVSVEQIDETLTSLRREIAHGRVVVVLGDSALRWHPPLKSDETLAAMLEAGSERAGVKIRVVAHDGFDAVAYYLLVDALAALRPTAVVLTANLQSFTDAWFRRVRMKHPDLAAFVRPRRVPDAMVLPLEQAGIEDASLLVRPAFRAVGMGDLPARIDGYRTRFWEYLDAVEARAVNRVMTGHGVAHAMSPPLPQVSTAAPIMPPAAHARARRGLGGKPKGQGKVTAKPAYRFMDLYPANLAPEQSTVRVLAATVRDLVARDVRTFVFLAPLHLQASRVTGAYTQGDFPGAVRVVREAVESGGGHAIDLSEALPLESYFIDRYTHFTVEGNRVVADRVLDELLHLLTDETAGDG